jgi:hypothetical protein
MKKLGTTILILLPLLSAIWSCKKEPEEPDPYAFLQGKWRYANGAECVFDATTKSAAGTKVPTNDQFGFVVGEDFWRNVTSTGENKWQYEQIVRHSDKKTIEYRISTISQKDANTLSMNTPGLSDSEMTRVTD